MVHMEFEIPDTMAVCCPDTAGVKNDDDSCTMTSRSLLLFEVFHFRGAAFIF